MITRRTFMQASTIAAVAAPGWQSLGAGEESAAAARATTSAIPGASGVYARSLVIDTLCPDGPYFDPQAAVDGGLTAAVVDIPAYPRNFPGAIEGLANWNDALRKKDSKLLKVLKAADLVEAKHTGRLGIILACKDGSILDSSTGSVNDRNLRNLRFFYDLGLRVLQLTHNERTTLGDSFREKSDAGLSRLGERVVVEMNALGMLIDVSHCGDRTTLEAIALSAKPCAVTHAGCRALQPTLRNKTDDCIRALADKGGYFGIYSMSLWLNTKDTASVEDVVDHIAHVVNVGGIDLVGFGSDGPVLGDETPQEEKVQGMRGYVEKNLGLPGAERYPTHVTVSELDSPKRRRRSPPSSNSRRSSRSDDTGSG